MAFGMFRKIKQMCSINRNLPPFGFELTNEIRTDIYQRCDVMAEECLEIGYLTDKAKLGCWIKASKGGLRG